MLRSLFTGVSGLRNHQLDLDVVSNNIANINTLGFKAGRATFKESFAQTLRGASRPSSTLGGTNPEQIGLGMGLASIENLFTQGQFEATGKVTDLAIQGDGFFVLSDGSGQFYTRAGAFVFDANGRLVSSDGRAVQGRQAGSDGVVDASGPIGDIVLPAGLRSEAEATTEVAIAGNLDASAQPEASVHESGPILARASAGDDLGRIRNGAGVSLGLADGHEITFVANATGLTRIGDLHTSDGDAISLAGATTLTITDGATSGTLTGLTDDSTLEDLRAALQGALANVTVEIAADGALRFANSGSGPIQITLSDGRAGAFNEIANGVAVAAGGTNFSARLDVRTDLRVGSDPGEVSTLDQLAAGLQDALREAGGAGAAADFGTTNAGRITLQAGSTAVTGISVRESGGASLFASSLGIASGGLAASGSAVSDGYLDAAEAGDALDTLATRDGISLGLGAGDVLTFAAARGGEQVAPLAVTVGADGGAGDASAATYGGLVEEIGSALGFDATGGVSIGDDGRLIVTADPGGANALSGVSLAESGNALLDGAVRFSETAQASDATAESSIPVFDSLGNTHVVTLSFTRDPVSENVWRWEAALPEPLTVTAGGEGTATFNPDGTLATFASTDGAPLTFDPATGAAGPLTVALDADGEGGLSGLTQFAAPSEVLITGRDGHTSGTLDSVAVDEQGVVTALFTNGENRDVAQIVLARFTNPSGLLKGQENQFLASSNSGVPLIVSAGSSGSTIASGAIEMSNVDLGREFTNLIIAQRGFQANARTISTSDEMLAELVNLKR